MVVKGNTQITQSETQFAIEDPDTVGSTAISLNQLEEMAEYDKVNINVKIIDVTPPQIVGNGKVKQDVIIADSTGTTNLTLWESDINTVTISQSYSMKRLLVRVFNSRHYLSLPSSGAIIEQIDDIYIPGANQTTDSSSETTNDVSVIGILELNAYKMCIKCTNRVNSFDNDDTLGRCQSCNMVQLMTNCEDNIMTQLVVSTNGSDTKSFQTVFAYGNIIKDITSHEKTTYKTLLTAKPFNMTCQHCMITSITRTD